MKSGYKLQWVKFYSSEFAIDGVEYKSLPSGIHDSASATVFISHKSGKEMYYGVCCFIQFTLEDNNNDSRQNLKMFSLGVLCKPKPSEWKPNEFINLGWEYIPDLREVLEDLKTKIKANPTEQVDLNAYFTTSSVFEKVSAKLANPKSSTMDKNNNQHHLLLQLPKMFQILGPLVFVIFKQSLLRKNIMIFNELHMNAIHQGDENENGTENNNNNEGEEEYTRDSSYNYELLTSFSYLLTVLSVVPNNIKLSERILQSQQPLYSVGLNELSSGEVFGDRVNGYIGVTSDEILKTHSIYDVGVEIGNTVKVFTNEHDHSKQQSFHQLKATIRDYHKFQRLYSNSFLKNLNLTHLANVSTDDLIRVASNDAASILHRETETRSKSSFTPSPLRKTVTDLSSPSSQLENEPAWWKLEAVEPLSWTESIWSAFSWFASAGQQLDTTEEEPNAQATSTKTTASLHQKVDVIDLLKIVGYFHKFTYKWFNYIDELIIDAIQQEQAHFETEEDQTLVRQEIIETLHISYQDMLEIELDPYSAQDISFIKEFVLLYYGDKVERVSVGYNLSSICC
ncbi:hypothetical protein KGF56_004679 [Candida oxycetoniae]|uniref:DUF4484 domain-containing protein n=1 Tax=Candida oxycetoniae TaxID=497107 RepID=A0AAI9WW23_9ASCO|nr:uncharacterized protein KGF56_004679 [Candida oxycetoniae]KAI3402587.2 hypothetical protein KGF56_004679 [Candida oxycetoniae]